MKKTLEISQRPFYFIAKASFFMVMSSICVFAGLNESAYTEDVTIPEYDSENSEHFIISSKSDWKHINDSDKRFFYVTPNAKYGTVTIKAKGTEYAKRYISLYNGNDTHPAKLDAAEQANVRLVFSDAHHWIVDRMSSIDHTGIGYCHSVGNHSQSIVLNRFYLTNFYDGITINGTQTSPYTDNIIIQNSRFDRMTADGISGDRVAIMLSGDKWDSPRTLKNTKILNNEIKNCNDGIMPIRHVELPGGHDVNYPGTIIDCNHIYVNSDVYTDGAGNHDPNGIWAWTENAIDLKAGSNDPDNPMIVSNNYLWGYKRTDKNGGGSGSWGTALGGHFYVKNVVIKNNVIFDSNRGISFAAAAGMPFSVENAMIYENILYNLGYRTASEIEYNTYFYESKNVTFEKNTILGTDKESRWLSNNNDEQNMTILCNVIIDSYKMTGTRHSTTTVENNTFYNTTKQQSGDGTYYGNASDANMADLTFTTDFYTNNPRDITLPGVVTTAKSPHAGGCFAPLPKQANSPTPANGSTNIPATKILSWTVGSTAVSHDVYFGTSTPPPFVQNQAGTSYDPGTLSDSTTYYWRIDEKNDAGTTRGAEWRFTTKALQSAISTKEEQGSHLPAHFILKQNYPNPFNPATQIFYDLPKAVHVNLTIYDINGAKVAELVNEKQAAGSRQVTFNAEHLASSVYLYKLQAGNFGDIKRMLFIK